MSKTAGTPRKYFEIQAQSIVVVGTNTPIVTMVLFKPTQDTLRRLRDLLQGDVMGPVSLIDEWDDGTLDTHISDKTHSFIALAGSGDGRKSSAFTLTLATPGFPLF
jgi:hypothetical protein